jgi:asparagine synthase (glutamine-hydrolysing)
VGRRLNSAVIGDYLLHRYALGPATFFQGVRKLEPGRLAIFENNALTEQRYFTPPLAETAPQDLSPSDALAAFRGALEDAVRIRLRSDAPYGVFLSGGLDSSVIAALMAREVGTVRSLSVGFEAAAYCELPYAARVASRLGARHEALTVTAETFAQSWPDAVRHRGAPVSEASDVPILMLSRAASASVKMVLTGEGADEILAGYPKHRAERWIGAYHALVPATLHRRLLDPLVRGLPYDARRLKILSRALSVGDARHRARVWFSSMDPDAATRLTGRPGPQRPPSPVDRSSLREVMLADQVGWLPDNLLERGDRMTMAAGIEGRAPFMDVELARLAAGLPDRALFDRRGGKAILRAAAKDWVDAETLNRPKIGFRTPVGDWFRGALRPMLRDLLCGEAPGVRRFLNGAVIDQMLGEHLDRRVDHTDALWTLANLELFLREHRLDAG